MYKISVKTKKKDFGDFILRDDLILELNKFDGDRPGASHRGPPVRQRGVLAIQPDSSLYSRCQVFTYKQTNKQTNKKQTQKKRIGKAILVSILILIFIYFHFFILRNSPFCPSESHTPYLSHRSGDTSEQVLSGQVVGEGALSRQGEGVPPPGSSLVRGGHHYEYYKVGMLHSHFTISTQH